MTDAPAPAVSTTAPSSTAPPGQTPSSMDPSDAPAAATAPAGAGLPDSGMPDTGPQATPPALVLGRLLALFYDLWPVLALWMLLSGLFNLGYYLAGHGEREILKTASGLGVLLWLCCWLVAGAYAVASWARGGQTLGMRPWRLRVVAAGGGAPTRAQLVRRYLVGNLSLLVGGLGFWWAWFDRDRLAWHDRASGTRMTRVPKPVR